MTDRRSFLRSTAAAGAALAAGSASAGEKASTAEEVKAAAHAAGGDEIKVALIGCGGRGNGAGVQTLRADPGTRIVALADAFEKPMQTFLRVAGAIEAVADRIDVPEDRQFTGLDCHTKLLDSVDVDLVILATPPGFRPAHYRAAVEAGKHVFAEKPVAVDGPGLRETLAVNELAKEKQLSVVSGLCWRYETGLMEFVDRIQDGIIGRPVSAQSVRYSGYVGRPTPRDVSKTDFEHVVRNWFWQTWLSGDFCVEQFVHDLDMVCWALGEYPDSVLATGGREVRDGGEFGNIYDHFAAVFDFASGLQYSATTRHQNGCSNPYYNRIAGTNGTADLMRYRAVSHDGGRLFRGKRGEVPMHQAEHDAMYRDLRAGKPRHDGEYMVQSTATGVMMRESAYTGKEVTRKQVLDSQEKLGTDNLAWDAEVPTQRVAVPGVTTLG